MVDIERKKKLVFHLRHLSVGLITNDDFESILMNAQHGILFIRDIKLNGASQQMLLRELKPV